MRVSVSGRNAVEIPMRREVEVAVTVGQVLCPRLSLNDSEGHSG